MSSKNDGGSPANDEAPPEAVDASTTALSQEQPQQQPPLSPVSDQWDDEFPDEKEWLDADAQDEQQPPPLIPHEEFGGDDYDDDEDADDGDMLSFDSSPESEGGWSDASGESDDRQLPLLVATTAAAMEEDLLGQQPQSPDGSPTIDLAQSQRKVYGTDDDDDDDKITRSMRKGAAAVAELDAASAELDDAAAGFIDKIIHARRQSLSDSSRSLSPSPNGSEYRPMIPPTPRAHQQQQRPPRWVQTNRTVDGGDPPPPTQSPMRTAERNSLDNRPRLPSRPASDDPDSPEHLRSRARFVLPSSGPQSKRLTTTTPPADAAAVVSPPQTKKGKLNTSTSTHTSRTSFMTDASILTPLSQQQEEEGEDDEDDPNHEVRSGSFRVPPPPLYQRDDDHKEEEETREMKQTRYDIGGGNGNKGRRLQKQPPERQNQQQRGQTIRGPAAPVMVLESESSSDPSPSSTSSEHPWFEDDDDDGDCDDNVSAVSFLDDPDVEAPSPQISKGSSAKHRRLKGSSSLSEHSLALDSEHQARQQKEKQRKRILWGCLSACILCSCLVGATLVGGAVGVYWMGQHTEDGTTTGKQKEEPLPTSFPSDNSSSTAPPSAAPTEEVAVNVIRNPDTGNGTNLSALFFGLHEPPFSAEATLRRTPLLDVLSMAMTDSGAAIQVAGSPQNRAYQWLLDDDSNVDDARKGNQKSAVHVDEVNLAMQKLVQRFALATFYFSTNGDQWDNQYLWMDKNLDECYWTKSFSNSTWNDTAFGAKISCNTSNTPDQAKSNVFDHSSVHSNGLFLTELEVVGDNLTGVLPPEIGLLPTLKRLVLSGDGKSHLIGADDNEQQQYNLEGSLPSELGLLTMVEALVITGHVITGSIPSEVGALEALTLLNLEDNRLSGYLPLELAHLTKLEQLDVSNNLLDGSISKVFSAWTAIREFQIQFNNFEGSVPDSLCNVFYANSLSTPKSPVESYADCPDEIICPCCQYCCSNSELCTLNWNATNNASTTGR